MTHDILADIDALDAKIGNSAELTMPQANTLRTALGALKRDVYAALNEPKPGERRIDHGATITYRPDLRDEERARQAQQQGDSDRGGYLPAQRERLRKTD